MTRVLLTGASGLLGTWLLRTAPEDIEVVPAALTGAVEWPHALRGDLRDGKQARDLVMDSAADLVIHGAYRKDRASIVAATGNVVQAVGHANASLVMLSTDAVYPGDGRPCAEDTPPDPVGDYGLWKATAERLASSTIDGTAVARLPLLVSLDPPDGMVERVRTAVGQQGTVTWYAGERRQPAYASEVAAALWRLARMPVADREGIWHLPGAEQLSRRVLGSRIASALEVADPGIEVETPRTMHRPRDLWLTGARAERDLGWDPSPVLI